MSWVFTVLLILIAAGIVGYAGWLLRRLFTTEPGTPDAEPAVAGEDAPAATTTGEAAAR